MLFEARFQFFQCFITADGFCKSIVNHRNRFTFYIIDMYREFGCFPRQSFYAVVFRERNLNCHIVACFMSFQLVFKPGDKAVRADFEGIRFPFSAFKCFSVYISFEVDDCNVAFFEDSTVFRFFQSCILLGRLCNLCHHLFISDFGIYMTGRKTFIFAELNFRLFNKGGSKSSTLFFRETVLLDFRSGYRNKLFLSNGIIQCLIDNDILCFTGNSILTEMHFKNTTACFSFTETGNLHLVSNTGNSLFKAFDHNFSRYFNRKLYLVLIQRLCFYVHKK